MCSSNSVKADDVEQYVFDRLAEVVQRPKIVEDVVRKLNKDRTVNVVPLQKEQEAIDKELAAIDAQRKKYFKLYERDGVDESLLIERLSEFKKQNERLLERKTNVDQRLMECTSDPIPVKLVQQLLGQFHSLLHSSPRRRKRPSSRASSGRFTSASRKTYEASNWNSTLRCNSIFLNWPLLSKRRKGLLL